MNKPNHKKNGAALVLTLGILALIAVMAVAFATMMRSEEKSGRNALYLIQARELASAGLNHAIAVLEEDLSTDKTADDLHDSLDEAWITDFDSTTTGDPDLNEDGLPDSQWIYVHENPLDATSTVIGRYAVLIQDEAGKVNLNTASPGTQSSPPSPLFLSGPNQNEGWSSYEVDLQALPGIDATKALAIVSYRYGGSNEEPGSSTDDNNNAIAYNNDGIDNNGNLTIDEVGGEDGTNEPQEFDPEFPYSNDRPFASVEELNKISGFGDVTVSTLKNYATVSSYDINKYWDGSQWARKININHLISTGQLYSLALLPSDEKYRLAANIIDYADRDYYPTMTSTNGASPTSANSYLGLEGLQINEVMCDFRITVRENNENFGGSNAVDRVGSTWAFGASEDSGGEGSVGSWKWNWDNGTYTINIFAYTTVTNGASITYNLEGRTGFISCTSPCYTTVSDVVIADNKIDLQLTAPTDPDATNHLSYFNKIEILAGKYIELINISKNNIVIDVTGTTSAWKLNLGGTLSPPTADGLPSTISGGTEFSLSLANKGSDVTVAGAPTYGYLMIADSLFALDAYRNDTGVWGDGADENGTVLAFSKNDSGTKLFDALNTTGTNLAIVDVNNRVIVYAPVSTSYHITGYNGTPAGGYSAQRINPSDQQSNWFGAVNTPSIQNDTGGGTLAIPISGSVKDHPFANIGEIGDVFLGTTANSSYDLIANGTGILDKITVAEKRLEAENAEFIPAGFTTTATATDSDGTLRYTASDDLTNYTWNWTFDYTSTTGMNKPFRLRNGSVFNILVYGQFGVNFESPAGTVRYVKPDHSASLGTTTTTISSGSFGLTIKGSGANPKLDYIILTPEPYTMGKININTAPKAVLQSLKGITGTIADNIISYRNSNPFNNIHELTSVSGVDESVFKPISNLITVRSDVYRVIVKAQRIIDVNGNGTECEDETHIVVSTAGLDVVVDRNPSMRFPSTTNRYRIESIKYKYN